jgi:hypothetical protein
VDAPKISAQPQEQQSATAAPATVRELVVLVGGYQSCTCPDDGTFDALKKRLDAAGTFDVVRFGANPQFPYDTYGAIAPSARNLRDQIRTLAPQYRGVHIVTHSMGGVVADQAFAQGLSASDGVATYVSLAGPHNGSDAARLMAITRGITGGNPLRESLLWFHMESESEAARDLGRARPIGPQKGVVRLDLRESTDVLVTGHDAYDPGVTSRVLNGPVEGHGGILTDRRALDQTLQTITQRRIPPDDRSLLLSEVANQQSERVGTLVLAALCCLAIVACALSLFAKTKIGVAVTKGIGAFLPRGTRKPCP